MATAVRDIRAGRTRNAAIDIDAVVAKQNELVRRGEITRENGQGGYTVFGRLVEIRYELTEDHHPPAWMLEMAKVRGLVIDWGSPKEGPLLGKSRDGELLVISKVSPLPDIPDLSFTQHTMIRLDGNEIPLSSIPIDMRPGLKNSDGTPVIGTNQEIIKPKMQRQNFVDHCTGHIGRLMVFRPIFEGLVKLAGIASMVKIKFEAQGAVMPGFYLDPESGEGHFIGGKVVL